MNENQLPPNDDPSGSSVWSNDECINILKLAEIAYGPAMRKGIDKPAFIHCFDVLEECELKNISDSSKVALIYTLALLHDILEDFEVTPDRLQKKLCLTDQEIDLLKLLSRNYQTDPAISYIEQIMQDEDAALVKCADRIANIKDLLRWVQNERGFTESAALTAQKYLDETTQMLELLTQSHPNLSIDPALYPLSMMYSKLKVQLVELSSTFARFKQN